MSAAAEFRVRELQHVAMHHQEQQVEVDGGNGRGSGQGNSSKSVESRDGASAGSSVDQILPGLYLGDARASSDLDLISRLKLTHILTAELIPLPRVVTSSFPNLATFHLPIADMPESDLLSHLEPAARFIREGLDDAEQRGAVLVHCYHGVSRSAAVVVAYLMKYRRIGLDDALEMLRRARPSVCPNDGFLAQLRLFGRMGCAMDAGCKAFVYYKLKVIQEQAQKTKLLPAEVRRFKQDQLSEAASCIRTKGALYRCKKCRQILACQANVLPHTSGRSVDWTDLVDIAVAEEGEKDCRSGIFVEPLGWMKKVLGDCGGGGNDLEGRLDCGRCGSKLGHYSWVGRVPCSCGAGFSPGFWINLGRVDRCTMLKEVEVNI